MTKISKIERMKKKDREGGGEREKHRRKKEMSLLYLFISHSKMNRSSIALHIGDYLVWFGILSCFLKFSFKWQHIYSNWFTDHSSGCFENWVSTRLTIKEYQHLMYTHTHGMWKFEFFFFQKRKKAASTMASYSTIAK